MRDDAGFVMSGRETLTSDTYAITSGSMELQADASSTFMPHALLGDAKIVATPDDAAIFVGIASTADVEGYLGGVRHATVTGLTDEPVYDTTGTAAPTIAPDATDIWVAQVSGTGTLEVTWPIEKGDWTVVVMNADASQGVSTGVEAGATMPFLDWLVPTLLALAGIGLVGAVVLLVLALRPSPARVPAVAGPPAPDVPSGNL